MDERQSLTETEIKDCIHALVQSMESQDSERFKPVISAVMDKYPAEKMGPEEFSVLLGYDVAEKLLMQLAYKYFPEAKKNANTVHPFELFLYGAAPAPSCSGCTWEHDLLCRLLQMAHKRISPVSQG